MGQPHWIVNYQEEEHVNNYLKSYSKKVDELATTNEVNFILEHVLVNHDSRIVDICCGPGRHILELARRGFKHVLGIDLSPKMTEIVSQAAAQENLDVHVMNRDMRRIGPLEADLVMNMFSSCGFFDTDEDNFAFFDSVYHALKPNGYFLLDITHSESYQRNLMPKEWDETEDTLVLKEQNFDVKTSRYTRRTIIFDKNNHYKRSERYSTARAFSFSEIERYFNKLGFAIVEKFGAISGQNLDFHEETSDRLIVISRKMQ